MSDERRALRLVLALAVLLVLGLAAATPPEGWEVELWPW
jgi:hypothetical protein